jgi:hypothetical protein
VAETTDADPERVAAVQRLSTAYLRTALGVDPRSWGAARDAFRHYGAALGRIDEK